MLTDRARDALSLAILVGFTFMLAGTSKSPSSSPSPSPSPATTSVTAENMFNQPDIDLALIGAFARCQTQGTHPACRLIKDFEAAGQYFESAPKVLWFGESIGIGGSGDTTKEPFFVQVETTPSGLDGSARTLLYSNASERADGNALLAAVRVGRTVPGSKSAAFMRTVPSPGGPKRLLKTRGRSLSFVEQPLKTYVRRLGDRLIVLEYDGSQLGHDPTTLSSTAWIAETFIVR